MKIITFFKIDSRTGQLLDSVRHERTIIDAKEIKHSAYSWANCTGVFARMLQSDTTFMQIDIPDFF